MYFKYREVMKIINAIMCCFVIVVLIEAVAVIEGQITEPTSTIQQDGDKWYWGIAEETLDNAFTPVQESVSSAPLLQDRGSNNDTNRPTEVPKELPSVCLPTYEQPEKPDFGKPGRRISESKCYEYIWELNARAEEKRRKYFCRQYEKLPPTKVVGGNLAQPGEFPHMAAIGWKATIGTWVFKCGGSLISEKFVLTAAHCSKASPLDTAIADVIPKIARIGDRSLLDSSLININIDISRIIVHPQYKAPAQYYDIALMELQEIVEFQAWAQPACLWSSFSTSELGNHANVTGWGVVESGSLEVSPNLLAAEVDVFELEQCDFLLKTVHNRKWHGFQDDQICAGKLEGVDSCQGDSGGPLQVMMPIPKNATDLEGCMHYIIGIISFGIDCGLPNMPGVYTRVSSYIEWIEDNVWNNQIN